jgi:CheY-like chemotaxis protein
MGKRILVVDDQEMVLQSVKLTLAYSGYFVETASNGLEALGKVDAGGFDLVLTDLRMQDMAGDELARQIKQRHPGLPIILLSGFPPETRPYGVDRVLLKPFSTDELRKAVRAACGVPPAQN